MLFIKTKRRPKILRSSGAAIYLSQVTPLKDNSSTTTKGAKA
jgi:hypothetical protein